MTSSPPARRSITARTPEDLLALVPVLLGFVPDHSVAMLTFGAARTFHARADLPDAREVVDVGASAELAELVRALLEPARAHGVRRVLFVHYTDDPRLARVVGRALARAFAAAGIGVVDQLRADGRRWWPAVGGRRGLPRTGVPYDITTHPFLAQAVLEGRVTHGSREELRRTLEPDRAAVSRVLAALVDLAGRGSRGDDDPDDPGASWVPALVERHVAAATSPTDAEVARLLRALLDPATCAALWRPSDRPAARRQADLWRDVLRRTPEMLVAAPAALLAVAAWQSGNGALAWCAVDRCTEVEPDHPVASAVAEALTRALPPDVGPGPGPDPGPDPGHGTGCRT